VAAAAVSRPAACATGAIGSAGSPAGQADAPAGALSGPVVCSAGLRRLTQGSPPSG